MLMTLHQYLAHQRALVLQRTRRLLVQSRRRMQTAHPITFTVSGSELSITSAGVLTFASAPDYETKTSYSATVTATDGTNSTTQVIHGQYY